MNARNGCSGVHSSGNLVFRIMCLVTLRVIFKFDVKNVHNALSGEEMKTIVTTPYTDGRS